MELEELRLSYRQLQVKMEELRDEKSLQNLNSTSTSLLSEIEQSIEAEEQEQEREQVYPACFLKDITLEMYFEGPSLGTF